MTALVAFPLATLFNSFSMTVLMLVLGIAGFNETVADIGIVQGATLALFYAFSGNARNLILADTSGLMASKIINTRIFLIIPLAFLAYYLSVIFGSVSMMLALVIIVRRISEWLGEIGLANYEKMNRVDLAEIVVSFEFITITIFLTLHVLGVNLAISAIPWSLSPLMATRGAKLTLSGGQRQISISTILPHFGSTVIIGVSVYVFRISITLLTDKANAGELFTAFAMGGVIPTIIGQALAPTLLHRFGYSVFKRWLLCLSVSMLMMGLAVITLSKNPADWLFTFGHSQEFFLAVGYSMVGGAIMSVAVVIRSRLAQGSEGRLVFGPDLMSNVLVIACVPFLYKVFGVESLVVMYCLSSILNIVFIWGSAQGQRFDGTYIIVILLAITSFLIFPLFFLIDGSVFTNPSFNFDTMGNISRLPIPISLLALFVGIAVLNNYVAATHTLYVVFCSVLLFMLSLFVAAENRYEYYGVKLLLLMQCVLPLFGLILGQMFGAATREPIFERSALVILLLLIPAQLASTWQLGYLNMQPLVFIFSIYQHIQYFPMIIVALVTMISLALWKEGAGYRMALSLLMPITIFQIVGSLTIMAIIGMVFGLAGFALTQIMKRESKVWALILTFVTLCCGVVYFIKILQIDTHLSMRIQDYTLIVNMTSPDELRTNGALNISNSSLSDSKNLNSWIFYSRGVVESAQTFLFGHSSPPERSLYPSANNYWLDILYNFGALAMSPIVILMFFTLRLIWQRFSVIFGNPVLIGTLMAFMYLLFFENMLKSGMRQPYPGIITFFIWGLLITRLSAESSDEKAVKEYQ